MTKLLVPSSQVVSKSHVFAVDGKADTFIEVQVSLERVVSDPATWTFEVIEHTREGLERDEDGTVLKVDDEFPSEDAAFAHARDWLLLNDYMFKPSDDHDRDPGRTP